MRPNYRETVVEATVALADEGGLAAVTIDRAAKQAGMTKGGVLYHFPSKQALLLALGDHLASRWEAAMLAALGKPLAEASDAERIRAYVETVARADETFTRADVAVVSEAWFSDELVGPWVTRLAPWFAFSADLDPADRARLSAVRLAADGLWMAETSDVLAPPAEERAALVEHLLDQTREGGLR